MTFSNNAFFNTQQTAQTNKTLCSFSLENFQVRVLQKEYQEQKMPKKSSKMSQKKLMHFFYYL